MKLFKRLICLLMVISLSIGMFAGCATKVSGDDAIISKGEFMQLYVEHTALTPIDGDDVAINLPQDSPYYEAAVRMVQAGLVTAEEAVENIDYGVTKEFVATTCVRSLYFRKTHEVTIKDAAKLKDLQACKDAVGHGLVELENGYFDGAQELTYWECMDTLEKMSQVDSDFRFDKEDMDVEVVLVDGLIDATEAVKDGTLKYIDPSDPAFDEIISGMRTEEEALSSDEEESGGASMLSNKTKSGGSKISPLASTVEYKSAEDAEEDDILVISMPRNATLNKSWKIGEYINFTIPLMQNPDKFADFDLTNGPAVGEITAINDSGYLEIYYTVRVATQEEYIASTKINGYSSSSQDTNIKGEQEATEDKDSGIKIGPLEIGEDSIKFVVTRHLSNTVKDYRDSKIEADLTYTFELRDIDVTCDGFGSFLKGSVDNAIFQLNYTVVNDLQVDMKPLKIAPANNGNGKFVSNLLRSRPTAIDAGGADEIKIARIYWQVATGVFIEFYIYLTIYVDGTLSINIKTDYTKGIKIVNGSCQLINKEETKKTVEANLNAELALNLRIGLKFISKKSKSWLDATFTVGIGLEMNSKVMIYDEGSTTTGEVKYGPLPEHMLQSLKENFEIDFCFSARLYGFYQVSALSEKCRIGKVLRMLDEDFSLATEKNKTVLQTWHFDDGKKVDACTKTYPAEEEHVTATEDGVIQLSDYKLVIPELCCGIVWVTVQPADGESLEDMGGLKVYVEDTSVATASISDGVICVTSVGVGSTHLIIETGNKRYSQKCSVTIEWNEY